MHSLFYLTRYFHLTNLKQLWLKFWFFHPSSPYLWLCLNVPQGHQAAQPWCVTASTFPHCTEGFFHVILSCQLPERPGGSHLEWCSGYEKVVTMSPGACQFLEGRQLCDCGRDPPLTFLLAQQILLSYFHTVTSSLYWWKACVLFWFIWLVKD